MMFDRPVLNYDSLPPGSSLRVERREDGLHIQRAPLPLRKALVRIALFVAIAAVIECAVILMIVRVLAAMFSMSFPYALRLGFRTILLGTTKSIALYWIIPAIGWYLIRVFFRWELSVGSQAVRCRMFGSRVWPADAISDVKLTEKRRWWYSQYSLYLILRSGEQVLLAQSPKPAELTWIAGALRRELHLDCHEPDEAPPGGRRFWA